MTDKAQVRIEYMALSELKRWPRNPKQHDIGAIHTSISRFGFVAPPTVDERTGHLVAGHGRLDTLEQMKAKGEAPPARIQAREDDWFVPVIRGVSFNSDNEVEAYLVADNRLTELGGWDTPELVELLGDLARDDEALLAVTGYDADDLDGLLRTLTFDPDDLYMSFADAVRGEGVDGVAITFTFNAEDGAYITDAVSAGFKPELQQVLLEAAIERLEGRGEDEEDG